ncbi:MAG: GSCFA domain-containing protein [Saprospiraceae bacterium]|nr:GSCFA domain-containing protein [Candidatus Brachybacter algidus]
MDELRDYRFYKSSMIHPSQVAVDLVWQYFQKHIYCP